MASVHALLLGLYVVPVALAMGWDAVAYRIPNWTVGVLVAGFPLAGLLLPGGLPWLEHLGAAALVFAVGAGLFAFRFAGGGDIKLLTAVALWVGWRHLFDLMVLMAVLGGVVVVFLLVARRFLPQLLSMHPSAETLVLPRVFREGEAVPYGIAIGVAALMMTPELTALGG
ncbi:A24 family peptidase [Azospirillum sp. sgz301742]